MCKGEIVIINDCLGVVVNIDNGNVTIKNSNGNAYTYRQDNLHSVVNPTAQAYFIEQKILKALNKR